MNKKHLIVGAALTATLTWITVSWPTTALRAESPPITTVEPFDGPIDGPATASAPATRTGVIATPAEPLTGPGWEGGAGEPLPPDIAVLEPEPEAPKPGDGVDECVRLCGGIHRPATVSASLAAPPEQNDLDVVLSAILDAYRVTMIITNLTGAES
jgi:hypothetical protein